MIAFFGKISLMFALFFSIMQSIIPLFGYWRNNIHALAFARPGAWGQFICLGIAYILLTIAFVTNDFSIAYVATNSHSSLPLIYRLTATWGAHEGSILLWVFILSIWTIIFSLRDNELRSLTLAVLGLISFCFLCFLLLTSNPFLITTEYQSGLDLNPLLQDPGFISHPPMLYMGYVGFSVTFAIAQAALIRGQLNATWTRLMRHFAIAAWCFLSFGILLGSAWAYRVLGWGGFWFWDPVENASLLPWLSGTALIHVLLLVEKKGIAKAWALLLALISFALSLLGTFLVRSGVLISVHTFANDPARGAFLLMLLTILTASALMIYAIRIPKLVSKTTILFSWQSREMLLLMNSVLLFIAMLTILLGTLYPLIIDTLNLGSISVGAPYFNQVMLPFIFILMIVMGFAPFSHFENQEKQIQWPSIIKKWTISLVSAFLLLWSLTDSISIITYIALVLSCFIILGVMDCLRSSLPMALAHFGFTLFIIGVILSSMLNQERELRMTLGNQTTIGPYQFSFLTTQNVRGPNYEGIRADFEVKKNNRLITHLYPEKRIYTVRDMVMTNAAIHQSIFRDLYIALGEPLKQNDWSVRIYYKPFIRFIWIGGIIMIIGGLLTFRQHHNRMHS